MKYIDIAENGKITEQSSINAIYNGGSVTSLCALGDNVIVGSNTGRIVRVYNTPKGHSLDLFASVIFLFLINCYFYDLGLKCL